MSTFKDRLLEERNQLDERINKLAPFIGSENFNQVSDIQKVLLRVQLKTMEVYLECLDQRIEWLEKTPV